MSLIDRIEPNQLPFAQLLGVEFAGAGPDLVEAPMFVRPDLCTGGGFAHRGAIMSFADTLGGAAAFANPPEGARGATTLESRTISSAPHPPARRSSAAARPSIAAAARKSGRRGSRPRRAG